MTRQSIRLLGNILLGVTLALLLITVLGMAGWIPKYWPTKPMMFFLFVMVILSRGLRRRRNEVSSGPPA